MPKKPSEPTTLLVTESHAINDLDRWDGPLNLRRHLFAAMDTRRRLFTLAHALSYSANVFHLAC